MKFSGLNTHRWAAQHACVAITSIGTEDRNERGASDDALLTVGVFMKRKILGLATLCVVMQSALGTSWADWETPDGYTYTQPAANPTRTVIVGVTLGSSWSGFPDVLAPNYESTPTDPRMRLDVELPLYVTWIMDYDHVTQTGSPQHVDPPVALTSYSWFNNHHGEFFVAQVGQRLDDYEYHPCAAGEGLEAPLQCNNAPCDVYGPFPLTSDGKLRITDTHGGIGSSTYIHLQRLVNSQSESYNVVMRWSRPGSWWDIYLNQGRELIPGMIRTDPVTIYHGGIPVGSWVETRIVAWASADIGVPGGTGPSPRAVDAGDLAVFGAMLGQTVRYGLNTETPAQSPTWQCNVWPFGTASTIDAADLALFASYLGVASCQLSKSGEEERTAILDWFGIAPTGETVTVGSRALPEYEVVDQAKNQRAMADPYGYRDAINSSNAKESTWGLVKERYR